MDLEHAKRKNEHLSLAEKFYSSAHQEHPFDQVRVLPNALPEIKTTEVKSTVSVHNLHFEWPFYFEAMTGGSSQAKTVNAALARVANQTGLAMSTGSLATMFKLPQFNDSFTIVRELNPDGIVIANLGANVTVQQAQAAINLIHADALEIHLNGAQEMIMPEGDRNFHWLTHIQELVEKITVPVIIKEVGFGMTKENLTALKQHGVTIINVAGRGGTNFAQIENRRNHQTNFDDLHAWGLTTPESLIEAQTLNHLSIIASGGITCPLDVIKAGAMGAKCVGVAGYFLHEYYQNGEDGLLRTVKQWQTEIIGIMAILGCHTFNDLVNVPKVYGNELINYIQQRQ
ncbi:type 2 isopentenyl-diphosphate Delta-isomerase [uncultured Limosilactobacillus sp.]|uniref:type 2 isopentenyl-diphosphate Delta-isomerase n=1 Tax=uncultured Limosilactobacillus sp. TaxID=2837629 RepID=UPI0026011B8E|nr:type 2 isopentenyl-diphosphate Delta-isomerase [uncultured Limosilactobacillus sp.]